MVLAVGVATIVVVAGLLVLAGIPMLAHLAAAGERRRLRLIFPGRPAALRDPEHGRASWPETGVMILLATLFWVADAVVLVLLTAPVVLLLAPVVVRLDVVDIAGWRIDTTGEAWAAVPAGLVTLVLLAYAVTALACGQAALVRHLLDPRQAQLAEAVQQLRKSRSGLVDAFETERRRIERDLHDGVQQRLVALTMTLGTPNWTCPTAPASTSSARRTSRLSRPSRTCAPRSGASIPGC